MVILLPYSCQLIILKQLFQTSSNKVDTIVNLANSDVLTFHVWHGHGSSQSTSDDSFDNSTALGFAQSNRAGF